jgi:hypothetical protein
MIEELTKCSLAIFGIGAPLLFFGFCIYGMIKDFKK